MKRPLTPIETKALAYLSKSKQPVRASDLGSELWHGVRTHGGGSSNPFTRPAGRVLHRLKRMGLVKKSFDRDGHLGWILT